MTVTSNLNLLEMRDEQTSKAAAVNLAISGLEDALSEVLQLDVTGATVDFVLPFDETNDLSDRSALRFILVIVSGTRSTSFNLVHPNNKHLFVVHNTTGQTCFVKTPIDAGVAVDDNAFRLIYSTGAGMVELMSKFESKQVPYDFAVHAEGLLTSSQVVGRLVMTRDVVFPANFTKSVGNVAVNPTSTNVLEVFDDGVKIGEVSVATNGAFTFTTVSGAEQAVVTGSLLTVVNQASADATMAGFACTLLATHLPTAF